MVPFVLPHHSAVPRHRGDSQTAIEGVLQTSGVAVRLGHGLIGAPTGIPGMHPIKILKTFDDNRKRREALPIKRRRVVGQVDKHLAAACVGFRGGEGDGALGVVDDDRVVPDLVVTPLRVELRVARDAPLDDEAGHHTVKAAAVKVVSLEQVGKTPAQGGMAMGFESAMTHTRARARAARTHTRTHTHTHTRTHREREHSQRERERQERERGRGWRRERKRERERESHSLCSERRPLRVYLNHTLCLAPIEREEELHAVGRGRGRHPRGGTSTEHRQEGEGERGGREVRVGERVEEKRGWKGAGRRAKRRVNPSLSLLRVP
eukprot:scaffold172591_cov28-Tisochrysis_lutea.AAC.1